jgi:hypothetical protein
VVISFGIVPADPLWQPQTITKVKLLLDRGLASILTSQSGHFDLARRVKDAFTERECCRLLLGPLQLPKAYG